MSFQYAWKRRVMQHLFLLPEVIQFILTGDHSSFVETRAFGSSDARTTESKIGIASHQEPAERS